MSDGKTTDAELSLLRDLLFGPEQAELREIRERLQDRRVHADDVSEVLPEAILQRAAKDLDLRRSLQPLIEQAIRTSVRRNPQLLAETLFPIIGSAVRKAVASALQGMVESINQLVEASFSLRSLQWRLEAWRTGKSYGEIALVRSLLYSVDQVFLIQNGTGLLLHHVISDRVVAKDPEMVSGMLTAIQNFVQDSFGGDTGPGLEMARLGDVSVWVQHGPQALLAAVVRGTAPVRLGTVLSTTLEAIHRDFAAELGSMDGDPAGLDRAVPLLKSCLLGQSAGKPTSSRNTLIAIAAVVLLVLAAWGFWSVWQQRRWDAYLELLKREPGIVVTSAERHGGKFIVAGMRDPLARDPAGLLSGAGIAPGDVTANWAPFLSLATPLAALREFGETSAAIERQPIHFDVGKSTPLAGETETLSRIGLQIEKLSRIASAAERGFQIEIAGQSDPRGDAKANRELALQRAEDVRSRLIEMGVEPRFLVTGDGKSAGEGDGDGQRAVFFRVLEQQAK